MEKVRIEGLQELEKALADLPKATARATLRRALKPRAEAIRDRWKAAAPRGDTGNYADSIVVGTQLTRRQAREAKRETKSFSEIHIGTSDPAGVQLEFGNEHQAAQPHARQVWESMKDETLVGLGEDLGREIEKSADRLARKALRLAAKG